MEGEEGSTAWKTKKSGKRRRFFSLSSGHQSITGPKRAGICMRERQSLSRTWKEIAVPTTTSSSPLCLPDSTLGNNLSSFTLCLRPHSLPHGLLNQAHQDQVGFFVPFPTSSSASCFTWTARQVWSHFQESLHSSSCLPLLCSSPHGALLHTSKQGTRDRTLEPGRRQFPLAPVCILL